MSADILRRLMDSAEEANEDISSKSFHGTLSSDSTQDDASSQIDALTGASQAGTMSGKAIFKDLTARAKHKNHISTTLGSNTAFQDYSSSIVGGAATDSELRRQLTIRQREDRRAREERFADTTSSSNSRAGHSARRRSGKRQQFNADGSTDPRPASGHGNHQDRQESNASPRTVFREPPARGYDPFNR